MSDWLHNLPVVWMVVVVFGVTYLITLAIFAVVKTLATGERARSFKAVSPGMLPPLGILFGLFVAFTAAQVWSDNDRADAAVNREASALRSVVILSSALPEQAGARLRSLIRSHIENAVNVEWPIMEKRSATLGPIPRGLADALASTLALNLANPGQQTAQRDIATQLEMALEARRQRILTSRSQVSFVKWLCIFVQAACALFAIAMVHSDNGLAAGITMGIFATGVATSVLLIAVYDRPFVGQLAIGPQPLLQVMPDATEK